MPCYAPIKGYYSAERNPNGKRSLVFDKKLSLSGIPIKIPCGKCIGCKLEYSRQWAVRCMHEKRMSKLSSFVTLTYAPENYPPGGTLCKRDLQLFMKRLRKKHGAGIRFYACGEYGKDGPGHHPHYHLLLYNVEFLDGPVVKRGKLGGDLIASRSIGELWPYGNNTVGEVSFESCAYVARYITKKITGEPATARYEKWNSHTGEVVMFEREFTVMSRRPGIGAGWFDKYSDEAYAFDSIIVNGHEAKPPRYYDNKYEVIDPARLEVLKKVRRKKSLLRRADSTTARLRVREAVELRKLEFYKKRML